MSTAASAVTLPRTSVSAGRLELVLVEDQAAEVAEAELAHPAQVAQAPAQPAAVAEARALGRGGVLGLGTGGKPGLRLGGLHLGARRGLLRRLRPPARRSWQQALHEEKAPIGAVGGEYSGAPASSIQAWSTRSAMRSDDHSAARERPSTRGSAASRCGASAAAQRSRS